jgi:hypothetical protein
MELITEAHAELLAYIDDMMAQSKAAGGGGSQATSSGRRPKAAQSNTPMFARSAEHDAHMEDLRRKHQMHEDKKLAAEKEKKERRNARAKAERDRRDRTAAERAQAGSSSTPSTPAPWPRGLSITGAVDAATQARRVADKGASLEQAAEHSARLRQREEDRIQEELRKMEALRLAKQIQRGD